MRDWQTRKRAARLVSMSAKDDIQGEIKAFLASNEMDMTADYSARGRPYEHLEQSELVEAWIAAFEAMVDAGPSGYRAARQREGDLASEIKLRGGEPPYAKVKDAQDRFSSAVGRVLSDPQAMQRVAESLETDFAEFWRRRRQSPQ
jgi:hypothetical protein